MADFTTKLTDFLDHFMSLVGNENVEDADVTFNKEFMALKVESQKHKEQNVFPAESGQQPVNKKKNRFKDILPFEYTRVQLHKIEGIEGSDYINANYIQGPDSNVTYIAAQGPLPHTVNDFWRMLWYHQIEIVVMACREVEMAKPKCHCYWPPVGQSDYFGAIKVTTDHEENISDDFIIRQLTAECQGETQIIRQFHYTAWPDHGRPNSATPIIRMVEMFREYRRRHDIPFVVHCSAGCGRTGTIIAIDFARTMLINEDIPGDFNVYSIVQQMRRQRPAMVQALDQYVFVYMAIVELVQRSLSNVPQPPPKILRFERESNASQTSVTALSTNDSVYQNVTTVMEEEPSSTELTPPTHPVPLARTFSSGNASNGDKPNPPPKPAKPAKPEPAKKPPVEPPPQKRPTITPRKTSKPDEPMPIPVPRRGGSPVPPAAADGSADGAYSVPKSSTPSRGPSSTTTSGSSITSTPNNTSRSILDTLIAEVGDVLPPEEFKEVTGQEPARAPDYTYSALDIVKPPAVPPQTPESTEFVVPENPLYETADLSVPIPAARTLPVTRTISPSSSSMAFSVATMRQSESLKPRGKKEKFADDTHVFPSRTVKNTSTVSPGKTPPRGGGGGNTANTKYSFPGNNGYGVRIGKPKGPRPVPAHWNLLNGIIH